MIFEEFRVSSSQKYAPIVSPSYKPTTPPSSSPSMSFSTKPTLSPSIQRCMLDTDCNEHGPCLIGSCPAGFCEYSFRAGVQKKVTKRMIIRRKHRGKFIRMDHRRWFC